MRGLMMSPSRRSSVRFLEVDTHSSCVRPTLEQVLGGLAPHPYTIANLAKFLQRNFCSEVLAFIVDVATYQQHYSLLQSRRGSNESVTLIKSEAFGVWQRIIELYINSNSANEINIPGHERERILAQNLDQEPPNPAILDVAYAMMYELLEGVHVQFLQSMDRETMCTCIDLATLGIRQSEQDTHEMILPPHRRAHGSWGGSRVYRKIMGHREKTIDACKSDHMEVKYQKR